MPGIDECRCAFPERRFRDGGVFCNACRLWIQAPQLDTEQEAELERVDRSIRVHVVAFLREVLTWSPPQFFATELVEYVNKHTQTAPDSPGRILRMLRRECLVSYEIIDRSKSPYKLLWLDRHA